MPCPPNSHPFPLRERLWRNSKNPSSVMLSRAKHLAFSVSYEDEILRLSAQNDIKTRSPSGRGRNIVTPSTDLRALRAAQ
jgi:hypothetical protein